VTPIDRLAGIGRTRLARQDRRRVQRLRTADTG
jgi:hypothetical protein